MISVEWYFQGLSRDGSCSEIQSILEKMSHAYIDPMSMMMIGPMALHTNFSSVQHTANDNLIGPVCVVFDLLFFVKPDA